MQWPAYQVFCILLFLFFSYIYNYLSSLYPVLFIKWWCKLFFLAANFGFFSLFSLSITDYFRLQLPCFVSPVLCPTSFLVGEYLLQLKLSQYVIYSDMTIGSSYQHFKIWTQVRDHNKSKPSLQSYERRKMCLILFLYTLNICTQTRGGILLSPTLRRPSHFYGSEALGSCPWLCSRQKYTFTQDAILSPQIAILTGMNCNFKVVLICIFDG